MRLLKIGVILLLLLGSSCFAVDLPELSKCDVCTKVLKVSKKSLIANSRDSAVMVHSTSPWGKATGTGGYFTYKGRHLIITASHVIQAPMGVTIEAAGEYVTATVVYNDSIEDIAVLVIPELETKKAIPLRVAPENSLEISQEVFYSGHPNMDGLMTIAGAVMSITDYDDIFIDSYAWPGSSGSCVFDSKGRLVGVVSAISIGETDGSHQILENVVIVIPAWKIDLDSLDRNRW